ncbi:hypothetical protein ACUY1T_10030 [Billgrantia sp. Q4P2]|uniref:hypothetical protein n=1 Tax=Billgrantia sp. Q4P2 TaxID=3463857 RepID=UPI0040578901
MTTTAVATMLKRGRKLARLPRRVWRKIGPRRYPVKDLSQEALGPLEALYAYRDLPCLICCRLADCRWFGSTGIAYGRNSLHPYVQSLHQYVRGEYRGYKGSCLEAYWQRWQPASLATSLGLCEENSHPWLQAAPPLSDFMPWSDMAQVEVLRAYAEPKSHGSTHDGPKMSETAVRQVGPKPAWFGEHRLGKLIHLYETILRDGYRRHASQQLGYFQQHIVVDTLERDGEVRFVVANGQHRAAVLSVLGHEFVPVLVHVLHRRGPSLVRHEDCLRWPLVRHEIISPSQALEVFDRVFDERLPAGFPCLMTADDPQRRVTMP